MAVTALMLRTLGELHLSTGRLAEADQHLSRALAMWQDLGLALFHARTQRDLATLYDRRGDPAAAAATSRAALETFRRHGAREYRELTGAIVVAQG